MLRKIVEARTLVALAVSAGVGLWGLHSYPVSHDDVFLGLIGERAPGMLSVLTYGYATLWFTTPYFAASLLMSLLAIADYRREPRARVRPLPPIGRPGRTGRHRGEASERSGCGTAFFLLRLRTVIGHASARGHTAGGAHARAGRGIVAAGLSPGRRGPRRPPPVVTHRDAGHDGAQVNPGV